MTKFICFSFLLSKLGVNAFTTPLHLGALPINSAGNTNQQLHPVKYQSSTALNVWWFGGTPGADSETTGEQCELVAVRIDKTSANSRRIAGEIVVNASQMDVWSILTDYDNLSTHVPNLVKSKRVSNEGGEGGDGTHKCRLYQRGAQKIIGFEFGADVTMDMTESINAHGADSGGHALFPEERRIDFKCVDSQFFSEFDGSWRVVQMPDNPFTGEAETTVSYTVEVRPKGPVPVAALEWRIREDVPTNLRAVKKAALEVGAEGVLAKKNGGSFGKALAKLTGSAGTEREGSSVQASEYADFILDYENETLGAYLA
mmetsp:Transcript_2270/g.4820  ORF Transcript_2270/g.4820 Transcript_2270/m.4820 type:complete len:315 (+) Transcript_2270:50-994(+)|eukprot:CAMPEP_0172320456 /NCGR_PEP_ID=MMETSP1058-20130122/40644_1 /TAXON_ID=83371 /ORGANISM="Detonula confervacea, Strain CCMP 353" /LENGTH=314 /DNA_ID=CAMNT_0013035731 /DNA_START=153 /DNA_END=1097 /DNA_ORIENTATION=-